MPMIDAHVHLAALPEGDNGCYISPTLLRSTLFRLLFWKHGYRVDNPHYTNTTYIQHLVTELSASSHVQQAVVLGMDGVYDGAGRLSFDDTHFMVGNTYVLDTVRRHPTQFLAGVSINPQRRDAVDEVHRCADAGAALVKVIPNTQRFDPANPAYRDFYRALAARRLPLLSHVGYEFSLKGTDQSVGDPNRLRVPLDEGVTVIAAHACSSGLGLTERFLPTFHELTADYRNFYADISALTLLNRMGMLLALRRHPALQERLLFGTDYPLSVTHVPVWGRVGFGAMRTIFAATNRFDRQYAVCTALGVRFGSLDRLLPSTHGPDASTQSAIQA
ncbi:MAG: amidohydrolase family protein [Nitrospiraceae bacterium]